MPLLMPCALPDDLPWRALLEANDRVADGARALALILRDSWQCTPDVRAVPADARSVLLIEVEDGAVDDALAAAADAVCRLDERGLAEVRTRPGARLDPGIATAARVYLPVILGAARARRAGRCFVAGHVTQTLDGRIACENGQSQWIGNAADLLSRLSADASGNTLIDLGAGNSVTLIGVDPVNASADWFLVS